MRRFAAFCFAVPLIAGVAWVAPAACDRTAFVDVQGVMRWTDDRSEVAVFGVNYYTPFHAEYQETKRRGYDPKDVIRRDVAHLRRLGLDAVRLHCFDREISDREGRLVENEHLDLLDYLIATCASNGIYTILTPIAGWGGKDACSTNGFSWGHSMKELTSDPKIIAAEVRYEEEFARHVNRYTGRRYANDPAILAIELINEPAYPKEMTDEQVADYANALLAGIRRSGTRKPVFYNALWGGGRRLGVVPLLKTDGVSGGCYCTGLRHGHALDEPQLGTVKDGQFAPDKRLKDKAKIVYEFDAADVTGAYMYPAMARMFRSQGIQGATAFQYESTPIADDNTSYMTHYLHLVYTPEKALSLAIAAEAFRRLPRGCAFATNAVEMTFPPFRVDVRGNLSEMVTETDYLYTSTPATPPPSPEKLCRVWGCGSSAVVSSTGNGAYFLDRVDDGLWRLQLFPSVMPCADPFSGNPGVKVAILADEPTLTIRLPDLGEGFECWDAVVSSRQPDRSGLRLPPGDYILSRAGTLTDERLVRARQYDLPIWWAPMPHADDPKRRPWHVPARAEMIAAAHTKVAKPEDWNFLDGNFIDRPNAWQRRVDAPHFRDENTRHQKIDVKGWLFEEVFPAEKFGRPQTLVVRGRSLTKQKEPVELDFGTDDGTRWKTVVTLPPEGGEALVPLASLRHAASGVGDKGEMSFGHVVEFTLRIGRWLYPDDIDRPHGVRLDFVGCGK